VLVAVSSMMCHVMTEIVVVLRLSTLLCMGLIEYNKMRQILRKVH
jgi:hypothetical protein